jgi:hypothetical protein
MFLTKIGLLSIMVFMVTLPLFIMHLLIVRPKNLYLYLKESKKLRYCLHVVLISTLAIIIIFEFSDELYSVLSIVLVNSGLLLFNFTGAVSSIVGIKTIRKLHLKLPY